MIPGALVLAAGKSTRIASLSGGRPKPLLEIAGRPILHHVLRWLAASGVRHVWVNLHYRGADIRDSLGDGGAFGLDVRYSEEDPILGTAGAFRRLAPEWTGTTLIIYGDNLMRFDLHAFLEQHRARGAAASVALFDQDVHANTGIAGGRVLVDPATMRVLGFHEGSLGTAVSSLVNTGAYLIELPVLESIGEGFQDFGRDVFPALLESGQLSAHIIEPDAFCLGLDTPECFTNAETLLSTGRVTLQ